MSNRTLPHSLRNDGPRTLEDAQVLALLTVTWQAHAYREFALFSLALHTALRSHELLALDVDDVYELSGKAKKWITLHIFKGYRTAKKPQRVSVPDDCRKHLELYYQHSLALSAVVRGGGSGIPMFSSRNRDRLCDRQLRRLFNSWQLRAGIVDALNFHSLRHTSCSRLYRDTQDLLLVSKVARHANIRTTMVYTHTSDEEQLTAMKNFGWRYK